MKYRVRYYYLATGMEGVADERDYGVFDAGSEKDAIEQAVEKEYPSNGYSETNTYSRMFLRGCLSATKVQTDNTTMTDTEALDLIERHRLFIIPQVGDGWIIETDDGNYPDPDIIELARTRISLRESLLIAKSNLK